MRSNTRRLSQAHSAPNQCRVSKTLKHSINQLIKDKGDKNKQTHTKKNQQQQNKTKTKKTNKQTIKQTKHEIWTKREEAIIKGMPPNGMAERKKYILLTSSPKRRHLIRILFLLLGQKVQNLYILTSCPVQQIIECSVTLIL